MGTDSFFLQIKEKKKRTCYNYCLFWVLNISFMRSCLLLLARPHAGEMMSYVANAFLLQRLHKLSQGDRPPVRQWTQGGRHPESHGADDAALLPLALGRKWPLIAVESFSECWETKLMGIESFPQVARRNWWASKASWRINISGGG